MNLLGFLNIGVATGILLLGIFVYLKGSKKLVNRLFLALSIAAVIWIITVHLVNISTDIPQALFWVKLTLAGPVFFFLILSVISQVFPKPKGFYFFNIWNLIFFLIGLVIIILIPTDFNIKSIEIPLDGTPLVEPGPLYITMGLFIFLSSIFIVKNLYKVYKFKKGIVKSQIKYFYLGIFLTIIFGSITNLIFLILGIKTFAKFGPLFVVFILITISYSILAHRLFDIRIIIKRTLVYSALLAFVLVTYGVVVLSFGVLFGTEATISTKTIIPNLIAAILIAIGFGPLEKLLSQATDKWLFKGEYDFDEVLKELSHQLTGVVGLDEALTAMMNNLTKAMRIEKAATFVLRQKNRETAEQRNRETDTKGEQRVVSREMRAERGEEKHELEVKRVKAIGYGQEKLMLGTDDALIRYFEKVSSIKEGKNIIITEELQRRAEELSGSQAEELKKVIGKLQELKAAVTLPILIGRNPKSQTLNSKSRLEIEDPRFKESGQIPNSKSQISNGGKLIGIMILGEKLSGDIFSDKDLRLLEIAANQTAAAIEKARFYEEDQLKSEFVSIASHELLTPTSAIEGYLSMILDEHLAKVDKKAEGYLTKVQASAQRLAVLVKDLLNVSRIEGGRIVIQWQAFDVVKLIKTVVDELLPKANEKKLKLEFQTLDARRQTLDSNQKSSNSTNNYRLTSKDLFVFADQERVHQVLVNIIGNSIKYTEHGSVNVKCQITNDKNNLEIAISDTGIGISKEDQKHLFEKFFRATNGTMFGASGTGLGLYITKNLIELMNGRIWVESEPGQGSTFYFTLKLATPEQIRTQDEKPEGESYVAYKK